MENDKELKKAKLSVERALKIRLRSVKEIEEKLIRKGFSTDIIQETLSYFKKIKILDDVLFAKAWIQSRLMKPYGIIRIKHELKLKGIDDEIIKSELDKVADRFASEDMIENLIKKMKNRYKNIDPQKRKERSYGYLSRRGFNVSTVMKVIKAL